MVEAPGFSRGSGIFRSREKLRSQPQFWPLGPGIPDRALHVLPFLKHALVTGVLSALISFDLRQKVLAFAFVVGLAWS